MDPLLAIGLFAISFVCATVAYSQGRKTGGAVAKKNLVNKVESAESRARVFRRDLEKAIDARKAENDRLSALSIEVVQGKKGGWRWIARDRSGKCVGLSHVRGYATEAEAAKAARAVTGKQVSA